jgi:hypothetical protein
MSHLQITISVHGQAVLHLRPVGDARGGPLCPESGGALSLWHAFIWHDSSWGRAWGKYFCSRGKTATGTKLAPVESIVLCFVWAPSATMSASSISFEIITCNMPTSRIALVEAEGIHLCNNLMHVFMHHILLGGKMNCCSAH